MRFVKYPEGLTLTFIDGFLRKVEKPRNNLKPLRYNIREVEFFYDLSNYLNGRRIPMNELMQWVTYNNENIDVEIVSAEIIKLHNINL
jgi:hypothetical protein